MYYFIILNVIHTLFLCLKIINLSLVCLNLFELEMLLVLYSDSNFDNQELLDFNKNSSNNVLYSKTEGDSDSSTDGSSSEDEHQGEGKLRRLEDLEPYGEIPRDLVIELNRLKEYKVFLLDERETVGKSPQQLKDIESELEAVAENEALISENIQNENSRLLNTPLNANEHRNISNSIHAGV